MSVRVRFAPAATGELHINNLRTALFNWLFARHHGGTFILRAPRDDRLRAAHSATRTLCGELSWLGLDWDEGPGASGEHSPDEEPYGPQFHRSCVDRLIDEGRAYRCYCPPRHLSAVRRSPLTDGRPTGHDGRCRDLTAVQRAGLEADGIASSVRLRIPRPGQTVIHDLVLGELAFENASLDDAVLLTPEGFPTPLLAGVVDDHRTAITHVIQGGEQLMDVPGQWALYRALGWSPPQYAHLPSIAGLERPGSDRPPGSASLDSLREKGYQPLALANHLARLGWSPRGRRNLLSMEELADRFDLGRLSRKPTPVSPERLDWFNRRCLGQLDPSEIVRLLVPRWCQAYGLSDRADGTELEPAEWRRTLAAAIQDELHHLDEGVDQARFAFEDAIECRPEAASMLAQPYTSQVLRAFVQGIASLQPFDCDSIDAFVSGLRRQFKKELCIRSRDSMMVIRAALTGRLDGPCLIVACQLLGRQRCIDRAQAALSA